LEKEQRLLLFFFHIYLLHFNSNFNIMHKPLPGYLIILLLFSGLTSIAQILPADTVPAKINYKADNDIVKFNAELRALRGIAGAPAPFYTHLWEFGDGKFSFEKEPVHIYADSGTYHPRIYATNNYDDGKPPPMRPGSIKIKSKPIPRTMASNSNFFKPGENIALKTNRMPRPEEEMVLLLGYKNEPLAGNLVKNGTLILFYNDQEFEKDNFKIIDIRTHHQETKTNLTKTLTLTALNNNQQYYAKSGPNVNVTNAMSMANAQLIKEKLNLYKNSEVWQYQNLQNGEERFMFLSIQTTPEMIKDTNAVVTLSAMMIPDDPIADVSVFDLELQIVASHDPNKMILKNRSMNYRFLGKNKELIYKVKFQNTGKGPAKLVNVGVKIPDVLDKASIKILKTQPAVLDCDSAYSGQSCMDTLIKKDSVNFIFRNIYLPGVQQDGVNETDSTKGFVEYSIKFKEKPKKQPFQSGAAIIFDKNEPIYTNKARAKFRPGISPGIISGYGFLGGKNTMTEFGNHNISLGFTISPYSPYRKYLQAELFISSYNSSDPMIRVSDNIKKDTTLNNRDGYIINSRAYYTETKKIDIDLVPIQLRYNLNSYIGLGLGGIASFSLTEKSNVSEKLILSQTGANGQINNFNIEKLAGDFKKNFADINSSVFADIQIGLVRKGPALGFRYIKSLSLKDQRLFTYLSWKI
jgi:hypothetical protein